MDRLWSVLVVMVAVMVVSVLGWVGVMGLVTRDDDWEDPRAWYGA